MRGIPAKRRRLPAARRLVRPPYRLCGPAGSAEWKCLHTFKGTSSLQCRSRTGARRPLARPLPADRAGTSFVAAFRDGTPRRRPGAGRPFRGLSGSTRRRGGWPVRCPSTPRRPVWVRHSVCVWDVALRSAGRSLRPVTAWWCWSPRPRRPGRQRQSKRTGHRTCRQRGNDGHHDRTGRNARHAGVNLGPGGDTTSSAAITRRVGHG